MLAAAYAVLSVVSQLVLTPTPGPLQVPTSQMVTLQKCFLKKKKEVFSTQMQIIYNNINHYSAVQNLQLLDHLLWFASLNILVLTSFLKGGEIRNKPYSVLVERLVSDITVF